MRGCDDSAAIERSKIDEFLESPWDAAPQANAGHDRAHNSEKQSRHTHPSPVIWLHLNSLSAIMCQQLHYYGKLDGARRFVTDRPVTLALGIHVLDKSADIGLGTRASSAALQAPSHGLPWQA